MTAELVVLPAARRDMLDQAEFCDAEAGERCGDRFLRACESSLARLIEFPAMGGEVPATKQSATGVQVRGCSGL